MQNNEIIAGKEIAGFKLGIKYQELLEKLFNQHYEIEKRQNTTVVNFQDFSFFVSDKTEKIFQITVGTNFKGKFLNKIGIGSTLQDIENFIGSWNEDLDVYVLPQYKGICFELSDNNIDEEWIEKKMPIEWISIYEIN